MKFVVDELPYYNDGCPFADRCWQYQSPFSDGCPMRWDKYKVCDDARNPHECEYLIEYRKAKEDKENDE